MAGSSPRPPTQDTRASCPAMTGKQGASAAAGPYWLAHRMRAIQAISSVAKTRP